MKRARGRWAESRGGFSAVANTSQVVSVLVSTGGETEGRKGERETETDRQREKERKKGRERREMKALILRGFWQTRFAVK